MTPASPPSRRLAGFLAALVVAVFAGVERSPAQTVVVFDQSFARETGAPTPVEATFTAAVSGRFTLRVESADRNINALLTLNGTQLLGSKEFAKFNGGTLEFPVKLLASNRLVVEMRGEPGTSIRVSIRGDDRVPPVIRATATPLPNARGWNATDVVVSFDCRDDFSGIAICPAPITVTSEGAGQVITGTAVDNAGNAASAKVVLGIDKTAPTITGVPKPAANAFGWHRTDVKVTFTCADELSRMGECSDPVVVTSLGGEGTHEVPGTARDRAGNVSATSVRLSIDATAPTIVASPDRAPDAGGIYTAPVTVSFACTDDRSGIAVCPEPVQVTSSGTDIVVPGTARDRADNSTSIKFVLTLRSTGTAPGVVATLTPQPNAAGWNNGDVTVTFACEDSGSGIQSCPPPQTIATEGIHEITATASDALGNARTISLTIRIDRTPPTITAAVDPVADADGWHRVPVTVQFSCADALSGVSTCPVPFVVTTDGAGQVISGTATDQAGNSATASVTINLDTTPPPPANRAPSANAGGPYAIAAGQPLTFAGSGSDPDSDPLTYAWTFGDDGSGAGATPSHTYLVAGDYTATLTVTDGRGGSATATASVVVSAVPPPPPANRAPSANAGGPYTSTTGQSLSFAGSGSDPDNDPLTYAWTFGDGASDTGATPSHTYLAAGNYTATLTVTDGRGGSATATASVVVSTVPPPPNRAPVFTSVPIVSAAHLRPYLYQALATDLDGDTLTFSITDGPDGMIVGGATGLLMWTPSGSQFGDFAVAIAVSDGRTGSSTQSFTIAVADASAPVVTLSLPSEALPGAVVTATAHATDNAGVASVRFEINGGEPTDHPGAPFQRTIQIPAGALAGTEYHVRAIARDAAGNAGQADRTFRITASPDLLPPSLAFNVAPQGTPGMVVRLSAAVTDNVGVKSVVFRAGDTILSTDTDAPFESSFVVPVDAIVGASVILSARAFDFSDNFSDAVGTLLVVALPDSAPPTVQLIALPTVPEGGTLMLSAMAADNVGVAGVSFFVNGVVVGSVATTPYTIPFRLPADIAGGTVINVEARATDFAGLVASSAGTVQVLPAPNRPPTADAGGPYSGELGQLIRLTAVASGDPDANDRLSYFWDFGDQSTGSGLSPSHAYATDGTFTITLTVDDGRGGVDTAQTTALVTLATDHDPPTITLAGPTTVLPGSQVTMTASAADDRGIAGVAFEVNGSAPADVTGPPFQRVVDVPPVASPGDRIVVRATARDAAGNRTSAEQALTIGSAPDTERPVVEINIPTNAVGGSTFQISASASDNVGVQSVTFTVNGIVVATLPVPPFEAAYPVPSDAPAGSSIGVVVQATDFNGNRGEASGLVALVLPAEGDSTPPSITLSAPLQVFEGRSVTISADAQDNVGLSSVRFFVNGANVATLTRPPFTFTYSLGSAQAAGTVLALRAEAVDLSGLSASATAQTLIASAATAGQGVLTGEVYDDTKGLPLAGAAVQLFGTDTTGTAYAAATVTDAKGRWVLRATEGQGSVRITRDGWTRVDRPTAVVVNQSIDVIDARLTPLATPVSVSAVLGGNVPGGPGSDAQLLVPSGSLETATNLSLTPISQQGLQGLLPGGWSPVAVADVTPHATAFANAATLSLPNAFSINAGVSLIVARWDDDANAWRASGSVVAPASGALTTEIMQAGQYALLLPDASPLSPPLPAPGDVIDGVSLTALSLDASTLIDPQPRVIFYNPGARSDVRGAIAAPAPISSGLPIEARILESYVFLAGGNVRPESFVEDLIFYQAGGPASGLGARFGVTPSQPFDPLDLQQGIITVELLAPALGPRITSTIGPDGGSASSPEGEILQVPPGALAAPLTVTVSGLAPANFGVTLPPGITVAGAAAISFSGRLERSATFSTPRPVALPDNARLLLVRAGEISGETKLVLVGRGVVAGASIVSDTTLNDADVFEGIRESGRYFFVTVSSPFGFANGRVLGNTGGPFAGALVTVEAVPIVSISAASGIYVAAASVGPVALAALDLVTADTGTAAGDIAAAGAVLSVDLPLAISLPRVTAVAPVDGAVNVALSDPIVIRFSKAIAASSVNGANAGNIRLTLSDGTAVSASISLSSANHVATLRPGALQSNTTYTVVVGEGVTDVAGRHLAADVTTHFTSLDTAPPPMPPAGNINAAIPDGDGFTTITATQGTAATHDTVTIVNVTQRTTSPVLLDPNGGFIVRVAAALTDKLQIAITDANGNQTIVPVASFTRVNADGSVSVFVGAEGGEVQGTGGTAARVAAGTFPAGAIVTIKPVAAASFPVTLTPSNAEVFNYAGGFEIDFGGATPTRYVDVSIPSAPGDTVDDQWLVSQAITIDGQPRLNLADTARLINGRVTTSSPPCPGVLAAGVYGVHKSSLLLGKAYGSLVPTNMSPMLTTVELVGVGPITLDMIAYTPAPMVKVCLAVLTGRVTVTANTVDISIWPEELVAGDQQIKIKNVTTSAQYSFDRDDLAYRFAVPGVLADGFLATRIEGPNRHVMEFRTVGTSDGAVKIVVPQGAISPTDTVEVLNLRTGAVTTFPSAMFRFSVSVSGGTADLFDVAASNAVTGDRPLMYAINPSPLGTGNVALRALPNTIDPTQAEIDEYNADHPGTPIEGKARDSVRLVDLVDPNNPVIVTVPPAAIVNGGIAWAFNGNLSHRYELRVRYDDGSEDPIAIPAFRVTATDAAGTPVKTIVVPSPPRDEPYYLGPITDDHTPPLMTTPLPVLHQFDPSGILTLTFNESMDADTIRANFRLLDATLNPVAGEVRISNENRSVTFVPAAALEMGTNYTIRLLGLADGGGNLVTPYFLPLNTLAPNKIADLRTGINPGATPPTRPLGALRDIQILKREVSGLPQTTLVAVADGPSFKFVNIDVTNPATPVDIGRELGGGVKQRVTLLTGVSNLALNVSAETPNTCAPGGATFTGDLAVTATDNTLFSFVSFYDVTNRAAPCLIGGKLLSVNPDTISDFSRIGTVRGIGHARGVAALQIALPTAPPSIGYMAYTAVADIGLFATDIGRNIPEVLPLRRTREAVLPGDYIDVVAVSNRLVAINRAEQQLEVISPDLAVMATLPLAGEPARLLYEPRLPFDANGDGTIGSTEFIDAVIVTAGSRIVFVDVTDIEAPRVAAAIAMPAEISDIDVDRAKLRLYATSSSRWFIVDYPRKSVAWTQPLSSSAAGSPSQFHSIEVDTDKNRIYVGTNLGLEVYKLDAPGLKGTATFTFFPLDDVHGIDYARGAPKPIRGAIVELRSGGSVIATTNTDASGQYSFDAPVGASVEVVVKAALGTPGRETTRVINNTDGDSLWTKSSGPFTMTTSMTKDIHAETRFEPVLGPTSYPLREAAPFAILDMAYQAQAAIRKVDSRATFPLLNMAWSPDNLKASDPVTRDYNYPAGFIMTSHYKRETNTLYILGHEYVDTDEYDSQVVLHEWAHYFEHNFSRSDGVGGDHNPGDYLDPRTSFGEGFATAFAAMLTDNSKYIDTTGPFQMDSTLTDIEVDSSAASSFYSEDAVRELLWDLYDPLFVEADAEGSSFVTDGVALGLRPIYEAMVKEQALTRAFTSVFSFLDALKKRYTATAALTSEVGDKIIALAQAENIDLAHADEFELFNNKTIHGGLIGNGVPIGRLHTELPLGTPVLLHGPGPFAGAPLSTHSYYDSFDPVTNPNGDGNKLYEYVFFKLTITTPGEYEFALVPVPIAARAGLELSLSLGGSVTTFNEGAINEGRLVAQNFLEPGTYAIAVKSLILLGGAWKPGPAGFAIRVDPVP